MKSILASLLLFTTSATSAVLTTFYGSNGLTTPFNTTDTFGTVLYTLTYDFIDYPQFQFVFSKNNVSIGMYYAEPENNKNSRIMAYLLPNSNTWAAAMLLPGFEVLKDGKWPSEAVLDLFWQKGRTGYLGLMVNPANNGEQKDTYYGYLKMSWNRDGSLTFFEEAYENVAGETLMIPKVPESSSFFYFLISTSLLFIRKR